MNTLSHSKYQQLFPSNIRRNMHEGVMYCEDEDKVYYTHYNLDNKRTRFTVRMLESGTITLMLIPGLNISTNLNEVFFEYTIGSRKGTGTYFTYTDDDLNFFTSPTLDAGDEFEIYVTWNNNSNRRCFGYSILNNILSPDEVTSTLTGSAKFEVFGNMGSLLCNVDDYNWKIDKYQNINSNTFRSFFSVFENVRLENNGGTLRGNISANQTSNLVNAFNLYLPDIHIEDTYCKLFYNCNKLKYGPRYLSVVKGTDGCCYGLFENCHNLASDYNIFIKVDTDNGGAILNYMFKNAGNGDTIYLQCDLDINNLDDTIGNFLYSNNSAIHFRRLVICPSNRTITNTASILGINDFQTSDNSEGTGSGILIERENLWPMIWVGHIDDALSEVINKGDMSEEWSRPYRYIGTVWVNDDYRSYYLWEYCGNLDIIESGNKSPGLTYILTSEKDFSGCTVEDAGKVMCYPIKHLADDIDVLGSDYKSYKDTYNFTDYTVFKQTGVLPQEDAGRCIIAIDDLYDESWDSDWNKYYKYFRNSEYAIIGEIDNYWVLRGLWSNNIEIEFDDPSYNENNKKWLDVNSSGYAAVYRAIEKNVILNTFINEKEPITVNGYELFALTEDNEITYSMEDDKFIIMTNDIFPETCDYIW